VVPYNTILLLAERLMKECEELSKVTTIPHTCNHKQIDLMLFNLYTDFWRQS
jgi:hypothetical protein